jgi:hypothetical protein
MKRLLKERASRPKTEAVAGIPIDSEYIVFVVDTSASMNTHWELANKLMEEILNLYPRVKGLQIMNDQGRYMLEGAKGQWLVDERERRDQILKKMRTWRPFSKSDPVPGMAEAIRTYWAPGRRFSMNVIGDEFTGDSIQAALDEIGRLNRPDQDGRRRARIHAIGYMNDRAIRPTPTFVLGR